MKNILIIDLDSDREQTILIGKDERAMKANEGQSPAEIITGDIATLCEALCTLIHAAEAMGVRKSHESLKICQDHLIKGFADASYVAYQLPKDSETPQPTVTDLLLENPDGITVRQFKEIIARWPEARDFDGEETTVWMKTAHARSSQVKRVISLNFRTDENGIVNSDICLEPSDDHVWPK